MAWIDKRMNLPTGTATRLWALDGATFTIDSGLILLGAQGKITIPVPAFLIEHPRGLVLFDTGVSPLAADDPQAVYGEGAADLLGLDFSADQRLDRQISALGYRLEDVKYVVVSHAHFDHTGGLYLFPHAELYIGEGELGYAYWPDQIVADFYRTADFDSTRAFKWNQIAGDHDLFGDGSIVILHTPGHTPGELSLIVRVKERVLILAGDVVHLRAGLEADTPSPYDVNTGQAIRSIRRLKQLSRSLEATVWISHDPDDWAAFGHAPRCYE